jgi:membrane-associated phospholipid phosphatase
MSLTRHPIVTRARHDAYPRAPHHNHPMSSRPSWPTPRHRTLWVGLAWLALIMAIAWLRQPPLAQASLLATQTWTRVVPDTWWHALTWLGDVHWALALWWLSLAWIGQPRVALGVAAWGLLPTIAMVHVTKAWVTSPRPAAVMPEGLLHVIGPMLKMGSFPSGHTATAFYLAAAWALSVGPGRRQRWAWGLAVGVAAAVGLSRVAVGAHWWADVLAGAVVGIWGAALGWLGQRRWGHAWPRLSWQRTGPVVALALAVSLWWRPVPADVVLVSHALGAWLAGWGAWKMWRRLRPRPTAYAD